MEAHSSWNIEASDTKGHRATVKLWPTGRDRGMRYRKLCGPWHNTGNKHSDYYRSQMDLQRRVASLGESANAKTQRPA